MPYKKRNSPFWKIQIRLPTFGRTGTLSSETKNRRMAERIESSLYRLAEIAVENAKYIPLIHALRPEKPGQSATITPMQVHRAISESKLNELLESLTDKPLNSVLQKHVESSSRNVGIQAIQKFAPKNARFSWLQAPENIQSVLDQYQQNGLDGKPISGNSVYRHLYQTISKILKSELGKFERDRILADVSVKRESDTRLVTLSISQIHELTTAISNTNGASEEEKRQCRVLVLVSLNTSADIRPIISTPPKNLETIIYDGQTWGILKLIGDKQIRKNGVYQPRNRPIPIRPDLLQELQQCQPFSITYARFYTIFKNARRLAHLEHIRPKDLRAVFSHLAEDAGIALTTIQVAMGHERLLQTSQYLQHDKQFSPADATRIMQIFPITATA